VILYYAAYFLLQKSSNLTNDLKKNMLRATKYRIASATNFWSLGNYAGEELYLVFHIHSPKYPLLAAVLNSMQD